MSNTILVGAQWGDEGKGKTVDAIARHPASAAKAADSARWFVNEQEQEKGEPNVLHVAVVRARGLKAADKSLMGTSSSDPFVTLQFGDKKEKTEVVESLWVCFSDFGPCL